MSGEEPKPPAVPAAGYPDAEEAERKKKKKKKKKKADDKAGDAEAQDDAEDDEGEETGAAEEHVSSEQEKLIKMLRGTRICEESRRITDKEHKFWDTQPVPAMKHEVDDKDVVEGPIETKTLDDVPKDPYPLPSAFKWHSVNVSDAEELEEVYQLLNGHYVEDDDCMFRFDYSKEFLRWALQPPHYIQDWHVGVRATQSNKLVAFITGIPARISVRTNEVNMAEINFLCVHKKLRSKRLAPVLIKEITRRVNIRNVWQAVYTAGVVLPRPMAECRYFHRSLHPKKLIEVGFSHLGQRMTMGRTVKLYKLPEQPQIPGLRKMVEKDLPQVLPLLKKYLAQFDLHPVFDLDDVRHWLLPVEGVVYSFVVENGGKVTDLCSFYSLPSSILGNDKYKTLHAAYAYWHVPNTVKIEELMHDSLIMAKQLEFDVFNALNVMENADALKNLKFGIGDGFLQYYLYNWRVKRITPDQIGLVLL